MGGRHVTYLLPFDGQTEQVLHDDSDVNVMFDLHKHAGRSLINMEIKTADVPDMSTHASRPRASARDSNEQENERCTTSDRYVRPSISNSSWLTL